MATTNPIPAETSFAVLARADMPVYAERAGVTTREMVGPRSPLPVFSDVRLFADTTLQPGAAVDWIVGDGEGGLLSVREGEITLCGRPLGSRSTALLPPGPAREVTIGSQTGARVIRAGFGPGYGLVTEG